MTKEGLVEESIVNSFIELIGIRIYMPREFISKAGSYGDSLYFILDGEAIMIGMGNDIVGIFREGSHYSNDIEYEEDQNTSFHGKSLCHLVTLT